MERGIREKDEGRRRDMPGKRDAYNDRNEAN